MDIITKFHEKGSSFLNMIHGAFFPLHGVLVHQADNHGNIQMNTTIHCDNGEIVDIGLFDLRNDGILINAHSTPVDGSPGEYELGDLPSPLDTRCIDARREAEAASR